jgi:hypothetical protein
MAGAVTVSLFIRGKSARMSCRQMDWFITTQRRSSAARIGQEILATKSAAELRVPLFIITTSANPAFRDARLGWLVGWDDAELRSRCSGCGADPDGRCQVPPPPLRQSRVIGGDSVQPIEEDARQESNGRSPAMGQNQPKASVLISPSPPRVNKRATLP